VALTVFSTSDGRGGQDSSHNKRRECTEIRQRQQRSEYQIITSDPWVVKTTQIIKIPPRVKQIVSGKTQFPKNQEAPNLVCVEPAQLPLEGVLVARGRSQVLPLQDQTNRRAVTSRGLRQSQLTTSCSADRVHVMVVNFSGEEIVLPKASLRRGRGGLNSVT
jgi:hypothetical protein